ncbi:MAG: hypothetical protein Q7T50_08220 [Candidatus Magasanikbacteria bacterium]|nr:hypothetical protein [Candidatus Magasanikbacteria bacterium]
MFKKYRIIISIIVLALTVSGCGVTTGSKNKKVQFDGGVFKSTNQGTTWTQKVLISTVSGAPGTFGGLNIASMAVDPIDPDTFYFGSMLNGMFYTYDGAESWASAKTLGMRTINSLAVDAINHCTIIAGAGNRVLRSTDCSRTWEETYYDNEVTAVIDDLAIDHYDSNNVFAAISRGDIIKSVDGGKNWQTVNRFNNRLKKIVIDPSDSRIVYAVTTSKGVFRSKDAGETWEELATLKAILAEEKLGIDIRDLVLTKTQPGTVFLATYYGLLRSIDGGDTWENLKLILPTTKATINAVAVNPKNLNEIFYVTNTTFYRSNDGGQTWSTLKLPSTRAGVKLFVNPEEPNIMYLGVK